MVTNTLAATDTWWCPLQCWVAELDALWTCQTVSHQGRPWSKSPSAAGGFWRRSLGTEFLLFWPSYCWYFPMVCQAPCCLQDQIRFFLFVHIDPLYQKAQDKILKTVSFKLVLLAAQIIRERRKGIESLVLRQLGSPSIKSSSVSESELFWASA